MKREKEEKKNIKLGVLVVLPRILQGAQSSSIFNLI